MPKPNYTMFILFFIICFLPPLSADPVIDGIHARQEQINSVLKDLSYTGQSISKEYDGKKILKKETIIKRSVWLKGRSLEKSEITFVQVNGKAVRPADIQRQMGGGQDQGGSMRSRMPFQVSNWNAYTYSVKGTKQWNEMTVDVVGFVPVKREMGYLAGEAYTYNGDIIYQEFNPAKPVFVMKQSFFSMKYMPVQGFWLPSKFSMSIEVEVKAIISFAHILMDVTENYSDYKINTGLEDSFFKKK